MQNPGHIALARQVAVTRQLDLQANNIANLDTVGFKRQSMLFREHLAQSGDGQTASFVSEVGSIRDLAQGSLRQTGRPLDLAVNGEGYFSVETPAGERFSRAGQFQMNAEGEIVTRDGHRLLDAGGEAIRMPQGTSEIVITKAGAIIADGNEIAQLQLRRFENPQELVHTSEGLYRSDVEGEADEESEIHQGVLENSNVNPVTALVQMLEIQRDYQGAHKMIKGEHDRLTRAIRELGRIEQG